MKDIFRRVEKKYIISKNEYLKIREEIDKYVKMDEYGKSTICNIYFDTDKYELISHSITKPYFKEKVRLRSYNVPNENSMVYLEIKRKEESIVGKRRIGMKLNDFNKYMNNNKLVSNSNIQIKNELDYYFDRLDLHEKMYISYDREAYFDKTNPDFRITFDSNIKARDYNLDLSKGSYGRFILEPDKYIMEVKTLESIPLWFVKLLTECKVMPCGFSKYGEAYTQLVLGANTAKTCVV